MTRLALKTALVIALLVWLPDFVVRVGARFHGTDLAVYLSSAVASYVVWLAVARHVATLRESRPRLGRAIAWAAGGFIGFLTWSVIGFSWNQDMDPLASEFAFLMTHPLYASTILSENSNWPVQLSLMLGTVSIVVAMDWLTQEPVRQVRRWQRVVEAATLSLLVLALPFPELTVGADVRGVSNCLTGAWYLVEGDRHLPEPKRPTLASRRPTRSPDIVLLLQESLMATAWHPWGCDDATCSPRIAEFLESRGDRAAWFPHATTNANATNISVPSLLTGLSPDAPRSEFATAPTLWHYARAAGYRTAFISAQRYNWAHLDAFFLGSDRPDVALTAAEIGGKRTADLGVDDAQLADEVNRFYAGVSPDQPTLLVVQFNATHQPAYPGPGVPRLDPSWQWAPRYVEAAKYVDGMQGRVLDAIEQSGRLEGAVVLGTSDHGEYPDPRGRPPRFELADEAITRAPLWIALPETLSAEEPELVRTLNTNRQRRVANADIVPTVVDVLGLLSEHSTWTDARLAGHSLLRPVPEDRLVVMTNVCDIRPWDRPIFAFYRGLNKWVVDHHGAHFFDLATDPEGVRDLYPDGLPGGAREQFNADLAAHPFLLEEYFLIDPVAARDARNAVGEMALNERRLLRRVQDRAAVVQERAASVLDGFRD